MGVLREDIMQEEKLRRRFYAKGCGGQPSIRAQSVLQGVRCVSKDWQTITKG